MDQETELIRQQMRETRESISEKVDALEQHVLSTIHDATDSVTSTVETVRDAVQGTVHSVTDSVEQTVEAVKKALDIRRHVERHPWGMLAGAMLAGYFGGRLLAASQPLGIKEFSSRSEYVPTVPVQREANRLESGKSEGDCREQTGERFEPAVGKLKKLAINASAGLIGDMILSAVSPSMRNEVAAVIDEFAQALGAEPLHQQDSAEQPPRVPSMGEESSHRNRLAKTFEDGRHV